jgi:hypothetical protein
VPKSAFPRKITIIAEDDLNIPAADLQMKMQEDAMICLQAFVTLAGCNRSIPIPNPMI